MVLDLFRIVGQMFFYYCSYELEIGRYNITIGAVFIFCGVALLIIKFVKGMAE